jgi:hypothetical protein
MALLAACGNDSKLHRVTHTDTFYQEVTDKVDILWVVDNSLSMGDEQEELGSKISSFIDAVAGTDLDWQMGVVTTDMEDDTQSGRLQGGPLIITPATANYENKFYKLVKEAGIDAAIQALTAPLADGYNAGFLRDEAKLSVVYLSDENDCTNRGSLASYDGAACYDHSDLLTPMSDLIDEYDEIKGDSRMIVSSIVGPPISAGCVGAVPGPRDETMADAFGGIKASICESDFSGILEDLGLQSAGLYTSFRLSYAAVPESIEVYVNDVSVASSDTNGWTYDETYQILYFHGAAVPDWGATITVSYDVAGERTEDTAG